MSSSHGVLSTSARINDSYSSSIRSVTHQTAPSTQLTAVKPSAELLAAARISTHRWRSSPDTSDSLAKNHSRAELVRLLHAQDAMISGGSASRFPDGGQKVRDRTALLREAIELQARSELSQSVRNVEQSMSSLIIDSKHSNMPTRPPPSNLHAPVTRSGRSEAARSHNFAEDMNRIAKSQEQAILLRVGRMPPRVLSLEEVAAIHTREAAQRAEQRNSDHKIDAGDFSATPNPPPSSGFSTLSAPDSLSRTENRFMRHLRRAESQTASLRSGDDDGSHQLEEESASGVADFDASELEKEEGEGSVGVDEPASTSTAGIRPRNQKAY